MSDGLLALPLRAALQAAALTPRLLVASDFDGTLAPLVTDPAAAAASPESLAALARLAVLPATTVAVISGRALADLSTVAGLPDRVVQVGSHGAEFAPGEVGAATPTTDLLLSDVVTAARAITHRVAGVMLELKPAAVAVHVRQASRPDAARVTTELVAGPGALPGVAVLHGKEVVELSVVAGDKGTALDLLRARTEATCTVFVGDDVTDEHAFARLSPHDVGIKVGAGDTHARFRVTDTAAAAALLTFLAGQRWAWHQGSASTAE